jgi:hypothetical protein
MSKSKLLHRAIAGLALFSAVGMALDRRVDSGRNPQIQLLDERSQRVQTVSSQRAFYDGQRFRLAVKPPRTGYLYLLCQTSQGEGRLLHPSARGGGNHIPAGRAVSFPQRGWFRFDQEPGTERLYLILSEQPIAELDDAAQNGGEIEPATLRRYAGPGASRPDEGSGQRGVEVVEDARIVERVFLRHDSR